MGVSNKDYDVSEQKWVNHVPLDGVSTGVSYMLGVVPYPCQLQQVKVASQGLSGTAVGAIEVLRFIAGAGLTGIVGLGNTLTLSAVGTSGVQSVSLQAASSTLVQLQAGDVLIWRTGGTNAAAANAVISYVVQALQDIKSYYGV